MLAFDLSSAAGMSLRAITYGATITSLRVPDRRGDLADVVLGFDRLESYLAPHPFFGAVAGRVAGRIRGGTFALDGETHRLPLNEGPNHLHGGWLGLDKRNWSGRYVERGGGVAVRFVYHSPDGEEGYPGNVELSVTYALEADGALVVETEASSDRATPVSPTQHSYFNLAGEGSGTVEGHLLTLDCDRFVAVDDAMAPTGEVVSVAGRTEDFRAGRRLGDAIPGLREGHGDLYLTGRGGALGRVARLEDPSSGRVMEVWTDEPCLQLYTGRWLDGSHVGKSGRPYGPHAGVCIECEGYPGGVDRPDLGDIVVRPGAPLRRVTRYLFSNRMPGRAEMTRSQPRNGKDQPNGGDQP